MERSLNLDIAERVSELEVLMKRVLPKNIMYRMILSKGMEFDGFRDYIENDDSQNIDWKASVRENKVLVRKYIEEKDLKFIFFIDVGDNMVFGSTEKLKCEYCAEMIAAISHLILSNGDSVGFVLFNDHAVKSIQQKTGNKQFETLVYELSDPSNYGGSSNLNKVLEGQIETLKKDTSLVFLVSDFVNVDESYRKNLEILSTMFETVAIIIRDPLDNQMPEINKEIVIEDISNNEKILINPKIAKNEYDRNALEQLSSLKQMFFDFNIDFIELSTDKSSSEGIAEFFLERVRKGRIEKIKNVY